MIYHCQTLVVKITSDSLIYLMQSTYKSKCLFQEGILEFSDYWEEIANTVCQN